MIETSKTGMFRLTGPPVFGKQDLGISPGGPLDLFSYQSGNTLLENPPDAQALEIILPPRLRFTKKGVFVLTGAPCDAALSSGNGRQTVEHGRVYQALPGQELCLGEKHRGFRTYLCYKDGGFDGNLEGRSRGAFDRVARWPDKNGLIRVVRGPEWKHLDHPAAFFDQGFTVLPDSNAMGLRLRAGVRDLRMSRTSSMISGPVSDGTVQLTPAGPIVLLRHRQTVGGYPRVFNVIGPDLDLLAQTAPGRILRFKEVSHEEALGVCRTWQEDLDRIRSKGCG